MRIQQLKIGFSLVGLVAVLLIMLPNLLYLFFTPPNDILAGNSATFQFWNVLENIGRFGLMLTLIILVSKEGVRSDKWLYVLAACFLLTYFVLWTAYFFDMVNGVFLLGMAVFPTAFFITSAVICRNPVASGFALLFGIVHISVTASNYL